MTYVELKLLSKIKHHQIFCFFKDIIQKAASNVLVALGVNASQEVMIEMLKKINPGALPHYYVILTLANLAKENGLFFTFDWDLQTYSFVKNFYFTKDFHSLIRFVWFWLIWQIVLVNYI